MSKMEELLNDYYKNKPSEYQEKLSYIKGLGCKVFRNSEGQHIIKYNTDDVMDVFEKINQQRKKDNIEAFMKGFLS